MGGTAAVENGEQGCRAGKQDRHQGQCPAQAPRVSPAVGPRYSGGPVPRGGDGGSVVPGLTGTPGCTPNRIVSPTGAADGRSVAVGQIVGPATRRVAKHGVRLVESGHAPGGIRRWVQVRVIAACQPSVGGADLRRRAARLQVQERVVVVHGRRLWCRFRVDCSRPRVYRPCPSAFGMRGEAVQGPATRIPTGTVSLSTGPIVPVRHVVDCRRSPRSERAHPAKAGVATPRAYPLAPHGPRGHGRRAAESATEGVGRWRCPVLPSSPPASRC